MTLPIHQSDVDLLVAVLNGARLNTLAEQAGCTAPNIGRKVKRIKHRIGFEDWMTAEDVQERANTVRSAGKSSGTDVLELIAERDRLKTENEKLMNIAERACLLLEAGTFKPLNATSAARVIQEFSELVTGEADHG